MPVDRRYGLVDLLWDAAFATVVIASVLLPPSSRTLLNVTLVTLGLWVLELAASSHSQRERPTAPETRLLTLLCAIALVIELLGAAALISSRDPDAAAPFGIAALAAAAAAITSRRSSPSDATLIALLGFHALACLPAILLGAGFAWVRLSGWLGLGEIDSPADVVKIFSPISHIFLPPLYAAVIFALVVERLAASKRSTRAWQILCLTMASWALVQAL
jgi:hypothetical protein